MSESGVENYQFPDNFDAPYPNAEERNEELRMRAEALNEDIILKGVKDLIKQKELLRAGHGRRKRSHGCQQPRIRRHLCKRFYPLIYEI